MYVPVLPAQCQSGYSKLEFSSTNENVILNAHLSQRVLSLYELTKICMDISTFIKTTADITNLKSLT